jgi:hypothetical protein
MFKPAAPAGRGIAGVAKTYSLNEIFRRNILTLLGFGTANRINTYIDMPVFPRFF